MQNGMKIDSKSPECRKFLSKLMDQLETVSNIILFILMYYDHLDSLYNNFAHVVFNKKYINDQKII